MPKRKTVPLKIQLEVALRQLGFEPHEMELDHAPALGLRETKPDDSDWDPPQHDAKYLVWKPKDAHKVKTFGTKATTAGSDIHAIAKSKRLTKAQQDFRARVLAKDASEPRPKGKWPSRSFQKRQRFER